MSQNAELEEIIYYRFLELEKRLEKKQEALEKATDNIQLLLTKAEAILYNFEKRDKDELRNS